MLRPFALVSVLAVMLLASACGGFSRQKHRLYATEPDIVRDKKIVVGMREAAVRKRLGKATYQITRETEDGKKVSEWQYYTVTDAWYPPGNDDTGVFNEAGDGASTSQVSAQPRLDLYFYDGTLVGIGDHNKRTWTSTRAMREGAGIPDEVLREMREKFYGRSGGER